ncbi:sensor domain-containing diguanylate cyclase [Deinococcus cellulosilyticus]|uniref:GGDEF domain-containing protein n=1 Tax=Deinococcus cellulosilyticus (strain DSM 18568 / NBRC 106333 / KACC 11606 / 5516J-15) TaxID=1223518 RepID=A0A511MVP5_DEIC1|nr:sensor domain-containing diguanylate cyclase [Deinococcus cellulosilyticus]GEM44642.1 hypothetical protein DC3_02770 [Deinococcus cellulosilyticus NBRC 106333 = KACC 11606]
MSVVRPVDLILAHLLQTAGFLGWTADLNLCIRDVVGCEALKSCTNLAEFLRNSNNSLALTAHQMALQGHSTDCALVLDQQCYLFRIQPVWENDQVVGVLASALPGDLQAHAVTCLPDRAAMQRTRALYTITRTLASASTDLDILRQIALEPCTVLRAFRSLLITFSEDMSAVKHYVYEGDFDDSVVHPTLQELKDGLTGWVMRERKMAYSGKETTDARESSTVQEHREASGCGCIVVLPIQTEARIFGTLTMIAQPDKPDLSAEDVDWLESLANIAATALEQRRLHEKLLQMAHHDPLTGLPNRTLFEDRLQQTLLRASRNQESFALLMLDLDGFKKVNDTLGHDAGDELLIEIACRLRSVLRQSDTVARLGGDEFMVLLPEVNETGALQVAEKIREQIEIPLQLCGTAAQVSASIGISLYPQHASTASGLQKCADQAMYLVKHQNKNATCLFSPT